MHKAITIGRNKLLRTHHTVVMRIAMNHCDNGPRDCPLTHKGKKPPLSKTSFAGAVGNMKTPIRWLRHRLHCFSRSKIKIVVAVHGSFQSGQDVDSSWGTGQKQGDQRKVYCTVRRSSVHFTRLRFSDQRRSHTSSCSEEIPNFDLLFAP